MTEQLPPAIEAMVKKLDIAIDLTGRGPLTTPALCVLLGRYVAYEAGNGEKLAEGVEIASAILSSAACVEAARLYGAKK